MKPAEFEEKEYEAPLYNQLAAGLPNVFSPGQVFENHIGVDYGLLVGHPNFWNMMGRHAPAGAFLHRYNWDFIWEARGQRRRLPNFRMNLFIQAKRPFYYPRCPRHVRVAGLVGSCWAFNVDNNQQQALERVANTLGPRATVVYAAAAFHTFSRLNGHTRCGTIIENSTFPGVIQLQNHTRWFYNAPGADGVANPEAEFSKGIPLPQLIRQLISNESATDEGNAAEGLSVLSKEITSSLDSIAPDSNSRVAAYFDEIRLIDREIRQIETIREPVRAFFHVATFARIFNLEWLTIT